MRCCPVPPSSPRAQSDGSRRITHAEQNGKFLLANNQLKRKVLETDFRGLPSDTERAPSRPPVGQSHRGGHSLTRPAHRNRWLSTSFQTKAGSQASSVVAGKPPMCKDKTKVKKKKINGSGVGRSQQQELKKKEKEEADMGQET